MIIRFKQKGDFSKANRYFKTVQEIAKVRNIEQYGEEGVRALKSATPIDTGKTADSWYYEVIRTKEKIVLSFKNSNIQNGVPIAIILQYGHGTRNGGWVEGRDYINPAIQPIFDKLSNDMWEEVSRA